MKYAEKEILVFNAFKELLFSNSNINKLTVSEIAKAAGIGKGTVYEYFKSKEDIIVKSILYNIDKETIELSSMIDKEDSFKKSCYILFDNLTNNLATICPYIKLLFNNINIEDFQAQFSDDIKEFNNLKSNMIDVLDKIISKGIEEGIVNKEQDINYQRYVLTSACSGITNALHQQDDIDIEKCKIFAYNMIQNSLK